jgi:hypothetical protein
MATTSMLLVYVGETPYGALFSETPIASTLLIGLLIAAFFPSLAIWEKQYPGSAKKNNFFFFLH